MIRRTQGPARTRRQDFVAGDWDCLALWPQQEMVEIAREAWKNLSGNRGLRVWI